MALTAIERPPYEKVEHPRGYRIIRRIRKAHSFRISFSLDRSRTT